MCVKMSFTPFMNQVWVVSWMLLSIVAQGMVLGSTPSLLASVREPGSTFKVDLNTISWLAASLGLAGAVGTPVAISFMHFYGRRCSFILTLIPGILGLFLIHFAQNVSTLMLGRVLGGFTLGGTATIAVVVIGEYTSPKHRGMFLNLKTASMYIGSVISHTLGHFCAWRTVAACILVPHILTLLSIATWPESPAWLASKQKFADCEKSFKWLRGKDDLAKQELEALLEAHKERLAASPKQHSLFNAVTRFFMKFTQINFLKPFFINITCAILLESTGRYIFPAFALQIIGEMTGETSNSFQYTICIDIIMIISSLMSSVLVKLMKRRTLLFSSGISTLVVLLALCPYLYLTSANIITFNHPWIPITMLVAYFIAANIGCVPVTLGLAGETYPFEHRALGSAIFGVSMGLCTMIVLKATPYLILYLKIYGTFSLLGALMVITLIVLHYLLPETKDRTLQEIEDYFNYGQFGVHRKGENVKILTE